MFFEIFARGPKRYKSLSYLKRDLKKSKSSKTCVAPFVFTIHQVICSQMNGVFSCLIYLATGRLPSRKKCDNDHSETKADFFMLSRLPATWIPSVQTEKYCSNAPDLKSN